LYTPAELGKRAMIFWLAGAIGQLFSGFLQTAAYTHLSGIGGLAGWRWLFVIDGIITLPLAILGFIFFPNLPQDDVKTWWVDQEQHELLKKRMRAVGRAGKTPWVSLSISFLDEKWDGYMHYKSQARYGHGHPSAFVYPTMERMCSTYSFRKSILRSTIFELD
jgi:ACS family pantothenate transporter-like MFS transporter